MVVANFVTVVRLNMVNMRQRARLRQHWSNVDIAAINGYLTRRVDGSCAKRLTIEFYTVVMLLTFLLIIISVPSAPRSFIPRLKLTHASFRLQSAVCCSAE